MASAGLRDPFSRSVPRADEFEARLAEREARVRADLAALENQLQALEARVAPGCGVASEQATLRAALETLRRELEGLAGARRAVATLRPGANGLDLAARRAAKAGATHDASGRALDAPSAPTDRRRSGREP